MPPVIMAPAADAGATAEAAATIPTIPAMQKRNPSATGEEFIVPARPCLLTKS
jgi:hypothetical protein